MEEKDRRSINTIGIVLIVFSAIVVFTNSMGAVFFISKGMLEGVSQNEIPMNSAMFIFLHYVEFCITMVVFGVFFLIGGIFLRKFKLWANRLVSFMAILLIVVLLYMCTMLAIDTLANDPIFTMMTIATTIAWSVPTGLLVWFLNRERIRALFT